MSNKSNIVEALVRPEIQALHSYHVPGSDGLLKLDAMENPHAWPGELSEEWAESLKSLELNRYPAPHAAEVKQSLAKLLGLAGLSDYAGNELDIILGNGSDEIIQMIAMCLAKPGATILAPEPSFVMYQMIATFCGMQYEGVPLREDFSLDGELFINKVKDLQPALIFIAQPNNPTGNIFEESTLRQIIEVANGLVVLDEAYLAFTDSDLLPLVSQYENVVVMRTLSKVGLAGLRCGFLIGSKQWLNEFDKVRLPYNINTLTQASVCFALQHYDELVAQTDQLRRNRDALINDCKSMASLSPFISEANFVLVRLDEGVAARAVFEKMKELGVLIKCLDGSHPLLANCLRLTVGTEAQNSIMLDALSKAVESLKS